MYTAHKYGGSPAGAVAAAVMSGMDQDCGGYVAKHAKDAMACSKADCPLGPLTLAGLDAAVGRLFRLRLRLGYNDFDIILTRVSHIISCSPRCAGRVACSASYA